MSRSHRFTQNLYSPHPAVNSTVDSGLYLYIHAGRAHLTLSSFGISQTLFRASASERLATDSTRLHPAYLLPQLLQMHLIAARGCVCMTLTGSQCEGLPSSHTITRYSLYIITLYHCYFLFFSSFFLLFLLWACQGVFQFKLMERRAHK